MARWVAVMALALVAIALAKPAEAGNNHDYLAFQGGAFAFDKNDTAALAGIQWRSHYKLFIFRPMAGALATSDGSLYGYGGFTTYFNLSDHILLRPSAAVGAYSHGGGRDLGGMLEFRQAIELDWRFADDSMLGIELSHMSNADIYSNNPGTENLTVNYTLPISALY